MRVICYEIINGLTSSALIGSLCDLGLDKESLAAELKKINRDITINEEFMTSKGIKGTNLKISVENQDDIEIDIDKVKNMIFQSSISNEIKEKLWEVIFKLINCHSRIEDCSKRMNKYSLTSVTKYILNIAAMLIALDKLNIDKIHLTSIEIGGTFDPVAIELLKGIPVKLSGKKDLIFEADAAAFLSVFGEAAEQSCLYIKDMSCGLDEHCEVKGVLMEGAPDFEEDEQCIIECNIDDMNPEGYEHIMNRIFASGALDVYLTQIIMKKGRPAIKLTVLCEEKKLGQIKRTVLSETSTFGTRGWKVSKTMLKRSFEEADIGLGKVKIKYGWMDGKMIKAKPEYEDCRRISIESGIPLNRVYLKALQKIEKLE